RLPVGHALAAGTVADTVGALGAAIDETYLEAAVRNLRLAEDVTEQIGGNADVLLAHAYRQLVITGLDQAGFGEHIHAQAGKQREGGKTYHSRSDRSCPASMHALGRGKSFQVERSRVDPGRGRNAVSSSLSLGKG